MRGTKKALTLLLALIMVIGIATPAMATEIEPYNARHPFTDVRNDQWFNDAVQFVWQRNIMTGNTSTTFNPNGNLTRAEVTALLFRMHHGRVANADDLRRNVFYDVPDNWMWPYVSWSVENRIVTGTSATTFNPNGFVTRQEFALMVYRYATRMTSLDSHRRVGTQWNTFTDRGQVSNWAYNELRWVNYNGVVTGIAGPRINPQGTANRAEAATMMMRLVNLVGGGNNTQPTQQTWTVTFDLNGGTGNFPNQTVQNGQRATQPANQPTRANHTFTGWNWNFNNAVTSSLTITANWTQNTQQTWTVTFDLNGGTGNFPNQTVTNGQRATQPTNNPTRQRFVFDGWNWNFNNAVTSNITVRANWRQETQTSAQIEAEVLRLVNQHRALYGLRPLRMHTELSNVARAHSTMMRTHGFMEHWCLITGTNATTRITGNEALNREFANYFDPNNTTPWPYIVGENISGTQNISVDVAERAVRGWINSPGHRGAIMNPNAYFIGVGHDGLITMKTIRPTGSGQSHFISDPTPPFQHQFNPLP